MSTLATVVYVDGDYHDRQDLIRKVEDIIEWHGLVNTATEDHAYDCARQITELILEAAGNAGVVEP